MQLMSDERRSYKLKESIRVNDIFIESIVIDPHVDKHNDHINDELILSIVKLLDDKTFIPTATRNEFDYYLSKVFFNENVYRLVWLLEENQFYIGVITAFKDKGASHDVS